MSFSRQYYESAVASQIGATRLRFRVRPRRAIVGVLLALLATWPGLLGELTREMVQSAYIQVSVFVAATLLIFYGAERLFGFNIGDVLRNARRMEVPLAALLGATPGCGGAVVVVAAYTSGNAGFGAVVATLTATMGDAAFLLIATRPDAALVVLPLSFVVGVVSGWIVDLKCPRPTRSYAGTDAALPRTIGRVRGRDFCFLAIAAPGLVFGIMQLLMIDLVHSLQEVSIVIALAGASVGVFIWILSPVTAMTHRDDHPFTRVAEETSFIAVWVIGAYLAYDYLVAFAGIDIKAAFEVVAPALPLAAIIVGFIPGCGPQVLVTTLYINGVIPFAAVLGNAISNDGDALFPAIALDPGAAIRATLYSAIPATIVAYTFYFLAPGFMN